MMITTMMTITMTPIAADVSGVGSAKAEADARETDKGLNEILEKIGV